MTSRGATFIEMPEGQLPADRVRPDGVIVYALTAHALYAIARHKWIESEREQHDLGDAAVDEWINRHWRGWVRTRLMEHFYGWRCWGGFGEEDFGLLSRTTVEVHVPRYILEETAGILAAGGENLDVIVWALSANVPQASILWLLERIDINSKRSCLLTDHIRRFVQRNRS